MVIKNTVLRKMLKEHGKNYTLTMYINRFFNMTSKQLDYVLNYKRRGDNCGRNRKNKSISCRN